MRIDAPINSPAAPPRSDERAMRAAAEEFEAAFLAEMLKPMGAAQARTSFGGGIGEDQFGSFLLEEQARAMVKAGGIGLAEVVFEALKARAEAGEDVAPR